MSDAPRIGPTNLEDARTRLGPAAAALPNSPAPGTVVLQAEERGRMPAVAVLDPHGTCTEPEDPRLLLLAVPGADPGPTPATLAALLEAMLAVAREAGHRRLSTGCDPMDLTRLRALEAAGFRTTGRQPYFQLGPAHIEYVSGYADATGAVMDLAVDLAPAPAPAPTPAPAPAEPPGPRA